jgi:hypothetical protein
MRKDDEFVRTWLLILKFDEIQIFQARSFGRGDSGDAGYARSPNVKDFCGVFFCGPFDSPSARGDG